MHLLERPDGLDALGDYPFAEDAMREVFSPLLRKYMNRAHISVDELNHALMLSRSYVYQLLQGGRTPSRNIVLGLALLLRLSLEETQRFLRAAQRGELYPKVQRDARLIYCIGQQYTLEQTCGFLQDCQEEPLL